MIKSRKGQEGFTLIELLVVVLIIGILAAIAIPAFLGQKKGAQDSASKSLLRNSAVAMESYYAETQDFTKLPTNATIDAALKAFEPSVTWSAAATFPDTKTNSVAVQVAGEMSYTLRTKSASTRDFLYHRAVDATVVKCKAEAGNAAFTAATVADPSAVPPVVAAPASCTSPATTW